MASVNLRVPYYKGNRNLSASCGAWSTTSTTYSDITNLSVSITAKRTTNYIMIMLVPDDSLGNSEIENAIGSSLIVTNYIKLLKNGSDFGLLSFSGTGNSTYGSRLLIPPGSVVFIDTNPGSGSNTYKLQGKAGFAGWGLYVRQCKLLVKEI